MSSTSPFTYFTNSKPGDSSQEYIISQNDHFHKQVEELQKEINLLKIEKDSLEEDNERCEKSLTALRGITQNEYEMTKMLEEIVHGYKNTLKKHKKNQEKFIQNSSFVLCFIYLIQFTLNAIGIKLPFVFFYLVGFLAVIKILKMKKNITSDLINPIYISKEKDYVDMRKNQDYVSKMIDSL